MSKVILYIAASLDGLIAGKDDDISWLFTYNDVDYGYDSFFSTIGAIIEGKRTYDIEVQNGWENAHPVPTFVMTRHIPEKKAERDYVIFTNENISSVLRQAKKITDKNIWLMGGANLAKQFLAEGLIDEIILGVVPVILGEGIVLFDNIGKNIPLNLIEVKQFDKGLIQLFFTVKK